MVRSCKELSPAVRNRHQWSGAERNRHQWSGAVRNRHQPSGAATNRQELSPTVSKAVLPSLYSQPVWVEPQADFSQIHFVYWRIAAHHFQPSISRSFLPHLARHEQESASIHRAAKRGIKCRWKKVDVDVRERGGCRTSMKDRWVR